MHAKDTEDLLGTTECLAVPGGTWLEEAPRGLSALHVL